MKLSTLVKCIAYGMYYNNALIGIEANFSTYPIKELERLGYNNQYVRETEDSYTHKLKKSLGFKTTRVTRPLILAMLQKIVAENIYLINDKATLEEMITFVRNERGRAEAEEGCHDDLVMGLAIAVYIRSQAPKFKIPKEPPKVVAIDYSPFGIYNDEKPEFDDLKETQDFGEELIRV